VSDESSRMLFPVIAGDKKSYFAEVVFNYYSNGLVQRAVCAHIIRVHSPELGVLQPNVAQIWVGQARARWSRNGIIDDSGYVFSFFFFVFFK